MTNHRQNFIALIILSALFCIFSLSAQAAAPANDNLANAQTLSGATGTINGTVAEATRQGSEFSHSLTGGTLVYRTVWYQWTATENKPAVFEISNAAFDSAIAVYPGNNFPLQLLSLNNDTTGNRPRIEFKATAGTTYKIVVGLFNTTDLPNDGFTMHWSTNAAPTNNNFANPFNLNSTTSGSVAITNQNADKETGEPAHINGNRSVWLTYTNTQPTDYSLTFETRRLGEAIETTLAVYTGTTLQNLSPVVKNNNNIAGNGSNVTFLAKSGVTYRIALDEGFSPGEWTTALSWKITNLKKYTDFATDMGGHLHYDNATDLTVFRPSDGTWWIRDSYLDSYRAVKFGISGDQPVPADYDGDGRSDLAVARDTPGGKVFYIANSFDGTYTTVQWGLAGDKPVTGDYDYDGRADIAVFRPGSGTWYIRRSSDGSLLDKQFGLATDIPISGGDFRNTPPGTDIAVFRPSNGTWYILNGDGSTIFLPFGKSGDKPVIGDFDNDSINDVGVYRPSEGNWFTLSLNYSNVQTIHWGAANDVPMIGNYDINSILMSDYAVYRPSDNTWYILRSEGNIIETVQFGKAGDIPVSSLASLNQ
jgi:hypothetical protein